MRVGFFLESAFDKLFLTMYRNAKGSRIGKLILKKKSKAGGLSRLIRDTIIRMIFR